MQILILQPWMKEWKLENGDQLWDLADKIVNGDLKETEKWDFWSPLNSQLCD